MPKIRTWIFLVSGLLLLFPFLPVLHPAFPANHVSFEVRTGGSDTNGGGYYANGPQPNMSLYPQNNSSGCSPGITCYSNSRDLSTTSAAWNSSSATTITCNACNYDGNIVNNVVYIAGGSCSFTPQWRLVTGQAGGTLTLDAAPSTATGPCSGVTVNVGGALYSPGNFCNVVTNNQGGFGYGINDAAFYMKNDGVYWVTTATPNVSGGVLQCVPYDVPAYDAIIGYNSTRDDWQTNTANPPVIRVCQNSVPPCTGPVNFNSPTLVAAWRSQQASETQLNYEVDCNGAANAQGTSDAQNVIWNVVVKNCPAGGFVGGGYVVNGYSFNSSPGVIGGFCLFCVIAGTTNAPSAAPSPGLGGPILGFSLVYGGSGSANYGFKYSGPPGTFVGLIFNTTIDGAGADCIYNDSSQVGLFVVNNILTNCAGKAINNNITAATPAFFGYNAEYNNAGGANNYGAWGPGVAINEITLSSSPFIDSAAHNYATNPNSGVWCAGFPRSFPDGQTTCVDMGGIQHRLVASLAADSFPNLLPEVRNHPEIQRALRMAFEGPRQAQMQMLGHLLVGGRRYSRTGDWILFVGVCLFLGGLAGVSARQSRSMP